MPASVFDKDLPAALRDADSLPSLPAVAVEVLRLTQDENSTLDDLAAALSRDPALAAKILRLSNSSLFSLGQEVTTLQRATMVLGLKTVKLMSLSFSLVGAIPRKGAENGFDFVEYWRRSLIRSVAARSIAELLRSPQGDQGFLCGLLVHFGRLVNARVLSFEYGSVIAQCGGWPTCADEERLLGFSSSDVCTTLLRTWNVPDVIYQSIGYASHTVELPHDAPANVRELVEILELTELVERVLCDDDKAEPLVGLRARLAQNSVTETEVDAFLIGLEDGISETASMLSIQLPGGLSHEEIMDEARQQIVHVGLDAALDLRNANTDRERLANEKASLLTQANTDRLTGLPNRGFFDDALATEIRARLSGEKSLALGLVIFDLDHFKRFNDEHGHAAGDAVLRAIGATLHRNTRQGDVAARYGGEEFVIIAPATNPLDLRTMVERVRVAVENTVVEHDGETLRVTASFGAACIAEFRSEDDANAMIKLSDSLLYRAKERGRNRCETYRKVRFPGR